MGPSVSGPSEGLGSIAVGAGSGPGFEYMVKAVEAKGLQ